MAALPVDLLNVTITQSGKDKMLPTLHGNRLADIDVVSIVISALTHAQTAKVPKSHGPFKLRHARIPSFLWSNYLVKSNRLLPFRTCHETSPPLEFADVTSAPRASV
jgi:hypothetical protein